MTDTPTPAPVDLTPEVLARWEELAAEATTGPWEARKYGKPGFDGTTHWLSCDDGDAFVAHDLSESDAAFIAESRTAVPALLSGVRSLQARITELETELRKLPHGGRA